MHERVRQVLCAVRRSILNWLRAEWLAREERRHFREVVIPARQAQVEKELTEFIQKIDADLRFEFDDTDLKGKK